MKISKRTKKKLILIALALVIILAGSIIGGKSPIAGQLLDLLPTSTVKDAETISGFLGGLTGGDKQPQDKLEAQPAVIPEDGEFVVEFIDVGQADCILMYEGENTMLIDGGNNEDGPLVASYIKEKGIDDLDYIICTHAHEDHCGGLDTVIEEIGAEHIMLPLTEADTKSYRTVVEAAETSGAELLTPEVGDSYSLGNAQWTILCCDDSDPDELNQSSIVIKMVYGNVSYMFTGDAETVNEDEMLEAGFDLDCDILKAGHHGSLTSNSVDWLYAVSPADIVISVGKDNSYNLPNQKVLARYEATGANVMRTDELGTIIAVSDGSTYSFSSIATSTDG